MATKQEYVRDALGLFDSSLSPMHDFVEMGKLLDGFSPNSRFVKVVFEAVGIMSQDLPEEVTTEIGVLETSLSELPGQYLDKQGKLAAKLGKAKPGTANFNNVLKELANSEKAKESEETEIKARIRALQSHNLESAHAHILTAIAPSRKKRSTNGANNGTLPEFEYGKIFSVSGYDFVGTLYLNSEKDWRFTDVGDDTIFDFAASVPLTSWTLFAKILRVAQGDYSQTANGDNGEKVTVWEVKKGDLKHARLSQVNAGGTGRLSVIDITPQENGYPTDTDKDTKM